METMPFGRFKNMPLTALSDGYLHWLASLPTLRPPLRGAVLAEIARRAADISAGTLPPPRDKEVIEELVGAGLRALARRHHPDVGGDTKKMQEINSAAEWLRRAAGGRT